MKKFVKIQKISPESLDFHEAAQLTLSSWIKSGLIGKNSTIDRLERHLRSLESRFPSVSIITAHQDDNLVGWLSISSPRSDLLEFGRWHPIISPDQRIDVVGVKLVEKTLQFARDNQFSEIEVSFQVDTESDERLFQKYSDLLSEADFSLKSENAYMTCNPTKVKLKSVSLPSEITIEKLSREDYELLVQMAYSFFHDSLDRTLGDLTKIQFEEEIFDRLNPSNTLNEDLTLVMREKNNIIGFSVVQNRQHDIYLDMMAIHPEFRRKGLGTSLLSYILTQLTHDGAELFSLGVDTTNKPAHSLYQNIGFKNKSRLVRLSSKL